jgi:hypothetical protein
LDSLNYIIDRNAAFARDGDHAMGLRCSQAEGPARRAVCFLLGAGGVLAFGRPGDGRRRAKIGLQGGEAASERFARRLFLALEAGPFTV